MNLKAKLAACALVAGIAASSGAQADSITGLYNTGLDANGNVITTNGVADAHYLLNGTDSPVVYNNSAYAPTSDSSFIAVQADGGHTINPNTYSLFFNLGDLSPTTAMLSGEFAADNSAVALLNGNIIGTTDTFASLTSFTATSSDFVAGQNVLSFVVTDGLPPSALGVSDLSGTAFVAPISAAPEPSTWLLMFVGIGGIGLMLRRAKKITGLRLKDAFSA